MLLPLSYADSTESPNALLDRIGALVLGREHVTASLVEPDGPQARGKGPSARVGMARRLVSISAPASREEAPSRPQAAASSMGESYPTRPSSPSGLRQR